MANEQSDMTDFDTAFNNELWMLIHGALAMPDDGEDDQDDDDRAAYAESASIIIATLLAHAVMLSTSFLSKGDAAAMIAKVVRDALDDTTKGGRFDA